MKRLVLFSSIVLLSIPWHGMFGQTTSLPKHIISVQPILRLDNLIPADLVGFSAEYERSILEDRALVGRVVWFRSPFFDGPAHEGLAVSAEYRFYFSNATTGWHLGPFVEWSTYESTGYTVGNSNRNTVDIGVLAGHKWVNDPITFDISVRTAWYSQTPYFAGGFFPYHSEFNSHLLISIGYSFN